MLRVCEIFKSIQGESSFAGNLCTFVRLSGCNLACSWCDTAYAREEPGREMSVEQITEEVNKYSIKLVEITGGEPLLQAETSKLCQELLQQGYTVLVETNGSQNINLLPSGVRRIVDVKCPGSGAGNSFLMDNLETLESCDEIKFVISSLGDAAWAQMFMKENELQKICSVIFSPVADQLEPKKLAEWIVDRELDVRMGLQLHRIIWGDRRGV
ncbi:MAG: 7-carboxy-7-deazaguanine synthase QueE [Chitinispirillaceae bacterium]